MPLVKNITKLNRRSRFLLAISIVTVCATVAPSFASTSPWWNFFHHHKSTTTTTTTTTTTKPVPTTTKPAPTTTTTAAPVTTKPVPVTTAPPVTLPPAASAGNWSYPSTLSNTGPVAGTTLTPMAPRNFTSADSGKTFSNFTMNVGTGQEVQITGSNITLSNCVINYTSTVDSANGFLFIGSPSQRVSGVVIDHCIINAGDRHEYNIRAYYGQFDVKYSQLSHASHNIDSGGDTVAGTTTHIIGNYIYDWEDNFHRPGWNVNDDSTKGHNNGIYFTGNNGTVDIEDNTVIGNLWEACTNGFSNGPGPGCIETGGTGAITVYADEDSNPDGNYIINHNYISGAGYTPLRFYGDSSHTIKSITITNNTYTAQSGYPTFSLDGSIYTFQGTPTPVISGNVWGSDTTCFSNANACKGLPNKPLEAWQYE